MKVINKLNTFFNSKVFRRSNLELYDADDLIAKSIIETLLEYRRREKDSHPIKFSKEEWIYRQKRILVGFYAYVIDSDNTSLLKKKDIKRLTEFMRDIVLPSQYVSFQVYGDRISSSVWIENRKVRLQYFNEAMDVLREDFELLWL